MNRRILITGAGGMLAGSLIRALQGSAALFPETRKDLDICDNAAVKRKILAIKPDIVVNCAAYTDVDGCESASQQAFAVNGQGVRHVAEACKTAGSLLVQISTDFIFSGQTETACRETDSPEPLSVYGKSKLSGEIAVKETLSRYLIVRTSWLFGQGGKNFVSTIARLSEKESELRVVDDQRGSPTYTDDLAAAIQRLIGGDFSGVYHVCNTGVCSWYEFALQIVHQSGKKTRVVPISSEALSRAATRPAFSALDCTRYETDTGHRMRPWQEALRDYLRKM